MQDDQQNLYRPEFADNKDDKNKGSKEKMWELMSVYLPSDKATIQRQIVNHVEYTLARTRFNFDNFGAYQAASYAVRDRLIESWNDTQQF
jgi:starch phosphorylase